jgi:predicted nucleic-acid-binding Zn-ribbon protein
MKNSQLCPKCDSYDVIRINGGSAWTGYQNFIRASSIKMVHVTRYLCVTCGFSEEWVEDPKGIELLVKKYGKDNSGSQFV